MCVWRDEGILNHKILLKKFCRLSPTAGKYLILLLHDITINPEGTLGTTTEVCDNNAQNLSCPHFGKGGLKGDIMTKKLFYSTLIKNPN